MDRVLRALEAVTQIMRARSLGAAAELFQDTVAEFGVSGYLLNVLNNPERADPRKNVLSNLDAAWLDVYFDERRYLVDPVVHRAVREPGSFFWADLPEPATEAARSLFADARLLGMVDGFVVSSWHSSSSRTVISLSAGEPLHWTSLEQGAVELAVSAFVSQVLLNRGRRPAPRVTLLSLKEQAVLTLAADGKTDKDIARELRLGHGTVQSYWERIRSKLAASNRAHAVALGLLSDQVAPTPH